MAAHGQQSFPGGSDAVAGPIPVPPANVMEVSVTPPTPAPESHYSLQTMIGGTPTASGNWPGEPLIRDEVIMHERSPRILHQNMLQNAQKQSFHYGVSCMGGSNGDRVNLSQYENLVGILGDQVTAVSAPSEKILSSSSLSGDQIGPRVKFMCSFGGKILPRPGDGKLRYAGGDTRIISIYRHSNYTDLISKMRHLYGHPVLMKYQLPNEELDALISVSCDEDVENMMEEYDRLQASDNSSKLRIFLFSPSEYDVAHLHDSVETKTSEKVYVDAINGVPDPVKQIGMVSTCCSGNLPRIDSSDAWGIHRMPMNMSVGFSSVPVSYAAVQSMTTSMFQPNTQILPRIYSASPSKPSSPTMASYMSHSAIPEVSHHLYPEKIPKGPVVHLHESLCTPHESAIWPPESRRLADSPTKSQNDNLVDHSFRLEQMNKVDTTLPRVNPNAMVTQIDSYGRTPRVNSQSNLMHLTSDRLHGDICTQSCVVHEQPHIHHTHYQYPLEQNAVSMSPHQYYAQQYCPHQHEETGVLNQMERPSDIISGHKPFGIINMVHHTCAGAVMKTESSPPSPRMAYHDRLNLNGVQHYLPTQGSGLNGSPVEQNRYNTVLQNPNVSALRGLKPLNTRLETRDQFSHIDDQLNKNQFSIPLVKVDPETRGTPKEHEGVNSRNYFMGVVAQPPLPLYVGGSPYREMSSPFLDVKATRGDAHENIQRDDDVCSHHQEGIDSASSNVHKDQRTTERETLNQIDMRDDQSSECSRKNVEMPHTNNCDSSYINPLPNDRHFNMHDPKCIDNPLTVAETLSGNFLCSSVHPAPMTESPFPSPLSAAVHMINDQGQTEACISSSAFSNAGPLNSLFVGNVEESQLINGFDVDTQQNKEIKRPLMDDGFQISPSPFLNNIGDGLIRHNTDEKKYSDPEVLGIPAIETIDLMTNKSGAVAPELSSNVPVLNSGEASACSNYLTEGMKGTDLVKTLKRDDLGGIGVPADDICLKLEGSCAIKSTQTPKLIENNGPPVFDTDSMHGTRNEDIKLDIDPSINNTGVSPTPLFTPPTISMKNWQDNMPISAPIGNDLAIGNGRMVEASLTAVEKVMETNLVDDSEDGEERKANKPMNLAAIAEEEAISRGLQTIKNEDLEELKELGTGTFGTVYHGKWRGTDVAIKRIKPTCFTGRPSERDRLVADFWKEAYILGQLHHPNVVAFYGVVPDGPGETLATVTEYMVNGSLKQVLQKKDRTIDRRKRLMIIMDAAFGMEYLHGKNIVHFDLKCENLLVNMKDPQRPICKVGDLGLSKVKHQTMVSGGVRGTLPWMAPELLSGSSNLVSEKVDVFSFGIVMWELLTGEEPYANMHYGAIIGGIVNNTLRPPVPSWCDPAWKSLMERCWSADPTDRPSFLEIAAELRAMASAKPPM